MRELEKCTHSIDTDIALVNITFIVSIAIFKILYMFNKLKQYSNNAIFLG